MNVDVGPVVPKYLAEEFSTKNTKYCLCIPIINEDGKIQQELKRAKRNGINLVIDIIICDGGSTDGSTDVTMLQELGVNTLLVKRDTGKQGAQLRMGFWWALKRGYKGVITIDGNNKDSIESVPLFIDKLDHGYDFVQGSRFIKGGKALNTPLVRYFAVRYIHAPIISLISKAKYTDTTNAFRGHSRRYLEHPGVQPFRDVFKSYELLAHISVKASQLGLRVCEVPVTRAYPKYEKTPTKISPIRGNIELFTILINLIRGKYDV